MTGRAQTYKTNEDINHLDLQEKKWFAIYTKYKAEKYVVEHLRKKQVSSYLPLLKKTKRYTRKIKHYEIPLINCYAFVFINKSEYTKVLETEYVLKFIKQGKNLISIPQVEIDLLHRIVDSENEIEIQSLHFEKGRMVEVINGQLTGLKGRLIEKKNNNEFVVELINIGLQLKLDINPAYLRPISRTL